MHSYMTYLHGEETWHSIKRLGNLHVKKAKLLGPLAFLLRCRDENTIPCFFRVSHHINTPAARRIYRCASSALLWERGTLASRLGVDRRGHHSTTGVNMKEDHRGTEREVHAAISTTTKTTTQCRTKTNRTNCHQHDRERDRCGCHFGA
ncbi:uncharacterized protein LOC124594322 [Schistocerca americana]|uniref:uncharacterized protein LOC124594322 n=1 Tax=Schistocerca americana TaxID=7009 RepID=UPI001F4FC54F|nr:uncharacterized protein LOC124594322 [Schistocerca americana]